MTTRNEKLAYEIYLIVSGADNKSEADEILSAILEWMNAGYVSESDTVEKLAAEFEEYYYQTE